jgi:hypothetical protein
MFINVRNFFSVALKAPNFTSPSLSLPRKSPLTFRLYHYKAINHLSRLNARALLSVQRKGKFLDKAFKTALLLLLLV